MKNTAGYKLVPAVCPNPKCGRPFQRPRTRPNAACSFECGIALRNKTPDAKDSSTSEVSGNTWSIDLPKTRITTEAELIAHFKIDTRIWEVKRFVVNAWDMGYKDADQKAHAQQLYQIKAWLEKKVTVALAIDELAALKEEGKRAARVYPAIKRHASKSKFMLEVQIPDLHLGKLAWAPETGAEHYDLKEAEKVFSSALDCLLSRTSSYRFDEIVFVLGNDLLHTDNATGTTTGGTPQDVDGRFHKTFIKARKLMTSAIEQMRAIAPVNVLVVPGNHDTLSTWCLGDSLECLFHKCPDVKINNDPSFRKYHQFGQVMLMFCHGNKGKRTDYPLVMATERSSMFGSTRFREAHVGHTHQTKAEEFHGVRVRTCPALCPPDAWHSENQYIGNQRAAEAYIWSADEGLVGTAIYTAPSAN